MGENHRIIILEALQSGRLHPGRARVQFQRPQAEKASVLNA